MSGERLTTEQIEAIMDRERKMTIFRMLESDYIIQTLAFLATQNDYCVPDVHRWDRRDEYLGMTNRYRRFSEEGGCQEHRVLSYFASQQEFEEALNLALLPIAFRDLNPAIDDKNFKFEPDAYTIIKVSGDNRYTLCGNVDKDGNFFLDVYPSTTFKSEVLQSGIDSLQGQIRTHQEQISKLKERISGFRKQQVRLAIPEE